MKIKELYNFLNEIISYNDINNSFNRKFIEIEYDEKRDKIFFYFIEEYSIRKFKIEYDSKRYYLNIFEYDSEERKRYFKIFSISLFYYESEIFLSDSLFKIILHFMNDLLDRYNIYLRY